MQKLNDFDEDYKEIISNRSLLSRLTDVMTIQEQITYRNNENGNTASQTQKN
jgi:hypothetical protein